MWQIKSEKRRRVPEKVDAGLGWGMGRGRTKRLHSLQTPRAQGDVSGVPPKHAAWEVRTDR